MRILFVLLLVTGCAANDFNYGPAEWLNDTYGVKINTTHPDYYEHFWDPVIVWHRGDVSRCHRRASGCAIATPERCDIYIPERASPALESHELKHCYGWTHSEPRYDLWWGMSPSGVHRDATRGRGWFPVSYLGQ